MFVSNRIMVEDRIQILECFDFLRGEEGSVDESECYEADVEEMEDLGMICRSCGGGEEYGCSDRSGAEVSGG